MSNFYCHPGRAGGSLDCCVQSSPMEKPFNTHPLFIFYLVDLLRQRPSRAKMNLKGFAKVFSQISQTQLEQTFGMMLAQ
jgi:hypothetical protein